MAVRLASRRSSKSATRIAELRAPPANRCRGTRAKEDTLASTKHACTQRSPLPTVRRPIRCDETTGATAGGRETLTRLRHGSRRVDARDARVRGGVFPVRVALVSSAPGGKPRKPPPPEILGLPPEARRSACPGFCPRRLRGDWRKQRLASLPSLPRRPPRLPFSFFLFPLPRLVRRTACGHHRGLLALPRRRRELLASKPARSVGAKQAPLSFSPAVLVREVFGLGRGRHRGVPTKVPLGTCSPALPCRKRASCVVHGCRCGE